MLASKQHCGDNPPSGWWQQGGMCILEHRPWDVGLCGQKQQVPVLETAIRMPGRERRAQGCSESDGVGTAGAVSAAGSSVSRRACRHAHRATGAARRPGGSCQHSHCTASSGVTGA